MEPWNVPNRECIGGPYDQRQHSFTKWEPHEEGGIYVVTRGIRAGHVEHVSKEWQTRTCEKCGFVERNG